MSTSRATAILAAIGLTAVAGGCLNATTTVELNADGSGTVTETVYVTRPMERILGMMSSMAIAWGQERTNAVASAGGVADRAKFEARASAMGRGVRLVSMEKATRQDGLNGVRAVYAFDNVSTLQVPVDPPYPVPDFGEPPSGTTARVTFSYEKGATPVLTVSVPWAQAARNATAARQTARPASAVSLDESTMLRHILDGFRARLLIGSPNGITGTDAAYTETSSGRDARRSVVLYDMDIGALVRNEGLLEQIAALGPARDMGEALGRYAGLPGLKIESQSTVQVRF